ncbi:TVP38/TMEM64 family protein [Trichothermofontia sp.]
MTKSYRGIILVLTVICFAATVLAFYIVIKLPPEQLQAQLKHAGFWAPLFYIVIYVIATVLILPSTALNLTGGAIFGPWLGTLWTGIAALVAAIVTFVFTRTAGQKWVKHRLTGNWQALDAEFKQGGLWYIAAIRLLPIIPYGLVNFAAGLTSISSRDYVIGTCLGTIPGLLPFVLLGSFGVQAIQTGDVLPLLSSLGMIGVLILGAIWYRRHRKDPSLKLRKNQASEE